MSSLEPKTSGEPQSRRILLLVAGIAVLALSLLLLWQGPKLFSAQTTTDSPALQSLPAFSATTVSGVGVINPGAGADLPEAGDAAPDFTLVDLDGNSVTMSELRGRPVILNFWATWCGPCRVEMPELEDTQAAYQDQGLVVLAVNQAESAEQVRSYLDELGLDLMAVLDSDGEVAEAYGAYFLPSTMFVDADGVITAFHRGIISQAQIDDYLAQTMPRDS